ncbi:MAG TPA: EAL domain-containing protein [Acidimicrobiales bacterium]|nr:EAL domain-containing protein [Acidimicrobiales bacterium]
MAEAGERPGDELTVELRLRRAWLEQHGTAVVVTDQHGTIQSWNAAAEHLFGIPAAAVLHRSVVELTGAAGGLSSEQIRRGLTRSEAFAGEFELVRDGEVIPIHLAASPILGADGEVTGTVSVIVDIGDRVRAEQAAHTRTAQMTAVAAVGELAVVQTSLSALLDGALRHAVQALGAELGSILMLDGDELRLDAAVGLPEELLGVHRVALGPASMAGFTLEQDDPTTVTDLAAEDRFVAPSVLLELGVVSGATAVMHVEGQAEGVLSVYTRTSRTFDADDVNVLRSIANVLAHAIERERVHQQLFRMAITDALTGLPNRVLFVDRLEHALAHLDGGFVSVAFGDLDGFKDVNDALGHAAGDALLRAAARRLADHVREGDTVARFGGDEFAVLFEGVSGPEEATAIAQGLARAVAAEPLSAADREVHVSISMGVVVAGHDDDPATLLRDADAAMYRAKSAGRGHVEVFHEGLRASVLARLDMTNELIEGIGAGQLVVHYQPEVRIDGDDVWAEALVRWQHPTRGLLMPAEFIDLAEETGLIVPLGEQVLVAAAEQMARWAELGPERAPSAVSVNLSARQLVDGDLVELTRDLLASLSLAPGCLWFELTETAILHDPDRAITILNELKGLGVGLAIDDFGTGYSSLAYARMFPVDAFKIDRSFISGMTTDPRDEGIVRATISLARSFGILSVAEGVETDDELSELARLGCDLAQGYLVCRPGPPDAIEAWVHRRHATARH